MHYLQIQLQIGLTCSFGVPSPSVSTTHLVESSINLLLMLHCVHADKVTSSVRYICWRIASKITADIHDSDQRLGFPYMVQTQIIVITGTIGPLLTQSRHAQSWMNTHACACTFVYTFTYCKWNYILIQRIGWLCFHWSFRGNYKIMTKCVSTLFFYILK